MSTRSYSKTPPHSGERSSNAVVSRAGNTGMEVKVHQGESHGNTVWPFKRAVKTAKIQQTVHAASW